MLNPQLWLDGSVHLSFHLKAYLELTRCIFMKHRMVLAIHQGLCLKESDFFPKKLVLGKVTNTSQKRPKNWIFQLFCKALSLFLWKMSLNKNLSCHLSSCTHPMTGKNVLE